MNSFDLLKKHYENRSMAAMEWKLKGRKVVGYIGDDVPEEMIIAAGFLPVRMCGDPGSDMAEADKFSESFYDPSVRSILNMLLTDKYNFLDYIIFSHSNDAVLKLYHQLWWINNLNPDISFPPVHLFDILHTKYLTTGLYVRGEVQKLKTKLEEWSGKTISNEMLSESIALVNGNRNLLKKIEKLRFVEPALISGTDALQIIGSSMFMHKQDHSRLLEQFLNLPDQLSAKKGIRLHIEGSDIDNNEFYNIIESCGAVIVNERNSWGNTYFQDNVDESCDPLEAIAERYHLRPSRYRIQSLEETALYCLHSTTVAKAQGTIFFLTEGDPAPTWDVPGQKKALEENNIPAHNLNNQKYFINDIDRTVIKTEVKNFLKSIKNI
ncbi:MAG: 2-hydroxyacyl-CoA dehydratase [Spirochaetes bacterium]|nr:2-hydroxyacyl-CoA dehydratase [Spirochaetota bacterium]